MMQKKRFVVTAAVITEAEKMAARGLDYAQIAYCLGTSLATLKRRRRANTALEEALNRGRSKGLLSVSNALFERATHGDTTAMIFYLKNRDPERWNDRRTLNHGGSVELSGPDGGPIPYTAERAQEILTHYSGGADDENEEETPEN